MASSSSSESGRLRSSTSLSHRWAWYCSGVIGTLGCTLDGMGVSMPRPPMGVAPTIGVAPTMGVAPTIGVAASADTAGVSSQRERGFLPTTGVAPMPGVASHCPPAGVAPLSAVGVSSQRLRRGVGASTARPGVASQRLGVASMPAAPGVASQRLTCGVASTSSHESLAFLDASVAWSQRLRRLLPAAGAAAGAGGGARPEALVGRLISASCSSASSFFLS
mmetsp:Transcript_31998/g.80824  ORF Transcript_31998/g.80824 Transcript_31998/m.80824 type:complete len:221 (+) Transcript_31998:2961-3623(+)